MYMFVYHIHRNCSFAQIRIKVKTVLCWNLFWALDSRTDLQFQDGSNAAGLCHWSRIVCHCCLQACIYLCLGDEWLGWLSVTRLDPRSVTHILYCMYQSALWCSTEPGGTWTWWHMGLVAHGWAGPCLRAGIVNVRFWKTMAVYHTIFYLTVVLKVLKLWQRKQKLESSLNDGYLCYGTRGKQGTDNMVLMSWDPDVYSDVLIVLFVSAVSFEQL